MLDGTPSRRAVIAPEDLKGQISQCAGLYEVLCEMDEVDIEESYMNKMYSNLLKKYDGILNLSDAENICDDDIGKINHWSKDAKTLIFYIKNVIGKEQINIEKYKVKKESIKEDIKESIQEEIIVDEFFNDIDILPGWPFKKERLQKPKFLTMKKVVALSAVGFFIYGVTAQEA